MSEKPKRRKMKTISYILLFSFFGSLSVMAQPIKSYKLDDMFKAADDQIALGDYFNALEWYRNIYKEVKSDDVGLSIAFSYYKLRDYENAERYYTRLLKDDEDNLFIDDRYAYGKTLRALDQKNEARAEFDRILSISDDEVLRQLAQNELNGMDIAMSLEANKDVIIDFGGKDINSGSGEYSPIQYDDKTLYFTSFDRRDEIVIDGKERDYHSKLYRSQKGDDGFGKPEELPTRINRDGFHVGGIAFSKDKRKMYFTRQLVQNEAVTASTIYVSTMGDSEWGSSTPLATVNGDFVSMQPAVGELFGEEVLFFVSDMDGGMGGYDIYYSTINGDNMSPPVNLGETINTKEDEIAPFFHDGAIYFSTAGLPGLGNMDLYNSQWDGSKWSTPSNLGHQYNSPFDDYSISMNSTGTKGFLVSNRPDEDKRRLKSETCCFDIYTFEIKELVIDLLVGVGTEEQKPLEGATVELFDQTIEDIKTQTQPEEYRFDFILDPERKYQIITSKEGYISDTVEITTYGVIEDKSIRQKVILKKIPEEPSEPEEPEFITETVTINQAIRLNNIYYNFEKWDILPDAEIDLQIIMDLMNQYDDMVIELSSHTDSRGTTPYNKDLSQKRAESAKDWLTNKGIAEDRIQPVGYGESVILNECVNGVRCTDDLHRFNRRTEFKILEGPETIEIKRQVQPSYDGSKQSVKKKVKNYAQYPVISFVENNINLGKMVAGAKQTVTFEFTNTGSEPLIIDLATACKCTEITWPEEPVAPGVEGKIIAIFDSTGMEGQYTKTIDIIANTDPIVVEAKFSVVVIVK